MKGNFYAIQELIKEGKSEEAIRQLDNYIHTHPDCNDEPYYLLGNAYRKQGNWQLALNNYTIDMRRKAGPFLRTLGFDSAR